MNRRLVIMLYILFSGFSILMSVFTTVVNSTNSFNLRTKLLLIGSCIIINFKLLNYITIIIDLYEHGNYTKQYYYDICSDYIKFGYYNIVINDLSNHLHNDKIIFMFALICIGHFITILYLLVNYMRPKLLLLIENNIQNNNNNIQINNNDINNNNNNNNDNHTYINIIDYTEIINYIVSESTSNSCIVCLEEQYKNELWSKLNCNHEFHKICLEVWLRRGNNTCPTCRTVIN